MLEQETTSNLTVNVIYDCFQALHHKCPHLSFTAALWVWQGRNAYTHFTDEQIVDETAGVITKLGSTEQRSMSTPIIKDSLFMTYALNVNQFFSAFSCVCIVVQIFDLCPQFFLQSSEIMWNCLGDRNIFCSDKATFNGLLDSFRVETGCQNVISNEIPWIWMSSAINQNYGPILLIAKESNKMVHGKKLAASSKL